MKILMVTLENYLGFLDTGIIHSYIPLQELGHEVMLFDYTKKQSVEMIDVCNKFKPDLIIYGLSEKQIMLEDMLYVKDILKINSFSVNVDCAWRYGTYFTEYAKGVNYVVTTEKSVVEKYKRDYINLKDVFHVTLWANDKIFYPMNLDNKKYDVSFVGRFHGDRVELLTHLKQKGVNINIFSSVLNYSEVNKIYNESKLVLSPSLSSDKVHKQDKLRFYEITASGACMMTDYDFIQNGNSFINDVECITYKDNNDLIDKVKFYLENDEERIKIALAGYDRCKKEHTSKIKLRRILEEIK